MAESLISVVIPVYNEAENIQPCLRALHAALAHLPHELLVCYDFDGDSTLPAIEAMADRPPTVRLVRNDLGRGVACAMRAGFASARGDVIVTTMADLSDEPHVIPRMAERIRDHGAHVVAGSRYMRGGRQIGGPALKGALSRLAGVSLRVLAGVGTHDATSNFRAYSAEVLRRIPIESTMGFEVALELTVKAHNLGLKVDEVPTVWRDRTAGESRFKLWKWLPAYLRWYWTAMAPAAFCIATLLVLLVADMRLARHYADRVPFLDDWELVPYLAEKKPVTAQWFWEQHNEHRIPIAKAVNYGVAKLTRMDGRIGAMVNVALLGTVAAFFLRGMCRWRGYLTYADAFIPLLLLSFAHWENMTWPFQIQFVTCACFACSLIYQVSCSATPTAGAVLRFGAAAMCCALTGANGLPAAALAPFWLLYVAASGFKGPDRRIGVGLLSLLLAAATYAVIAVYFVGYVKPGWHPPSPGIGATIATTARALCMGMGHAADPLWPVSLIGTLLVLGGAGFLLVRAVYSGSPERLRAAGLLVCGMSLVGLAGAIGYGRAGLGVQNGFNFRYTTLICPLLLAAYVAYQLLAWPAVAKALRVVLYSALLAVLWVNTRDGVTAMEFRAAQNHAFVRDLEAGATAEQLAERYHATFYPGSAAKLADRLRQIAEARLSLFRDRDPPASWSAPPR